MERREAPGVCEAPLGFPCDREACAPRTDWLCEGQPSGCQDGVANPVPRRARPAMTGLRGPPPGRCASRRSTADAGLTRYRSVKSAGKKAHGALATTAAS